MSVKFGSVQRLTLPGRATSLDFSNDGKLVAVGILRKGSGSTVQVFHTADGSLERELAAGAHACRGVAFVNDSHDLYYLAQHKDGDISLWSAPSKGDEKERAAYPMESAMSLVRDRPGRLLAVVGESAVIWDLQKKKPEVVANVLSENGSRQLQVAFAEERPALLYIYGKKPGRIVKHDLKTLKDLTSWDAPLGKETGSQVLASPTGRYVVAIGYNGDGVWIIDTSTGEKVLTDYLPEDGGSRHFVFTIDESALVTFAVDAWAFTLPKLELVTGPAIAGRRTWAAASCATGRLVGFAIDDNQVTWLEVNNV